ncbi:MAG: sugar transferase [Planctomycetota bacterium]
MKRIPHIRNLVVFRDTDGEQANGNSELLRLMLCNEPFAGFFLDCLSDAASFCTTANEIVIPKQWNLPNVIGSLEVSRYDRAFPCRKTGFPRKSSWLVVSDGRFITEMDNQHIRRTLAHSNADVIAVNVVPQLRASYEKVLITLNSEIVGFRLFYEDTARPAPVPEVWPHHLFVRAGALNNLLSEETLPLAFDKLIELCGSKSLAVKGINVGGLVLDLAKEKDLLKLMYRRLGTGKRSYRCGGNDKGVVIADSARLFGKILLGKGVTIGENAIIVGPAIVGNNVMIEKGAVVRASVICPGVLVRAGVLVEEKVLTNKPTVTNRPAGNTACVDSVLHWTSDRWNSCRNNFRYWPKFSYVRLLKRILDIVVSVIVLVLFAPVLPIVMLAIKLTSPGPIFFRDERQGLHGRVFKCLKFRTMQVGAAGMQERLRVLNQVDGPQFMMADDPRMSAVGRFLRETYIDEIPQFINVLLGQMSVVGPRPSPESENRLCPFWRDARLSVRPGITGIWQVCRTRRPMRDFQEWIHYDVIYVRDLSLMLDLRICWHTAKKMATKFISQF